MHYLTYKSGFYILHLENLNNAGKLPQNISYETYFHFQWLQIGCLLDWFMVVFVAVLYCFIMHQDKFENYYADSIVSFKNFSISCSIKRGMQEEAFGIYVILTHCI